MSWSQKNNFETSSFFLQYESIYQTCPANNDHPTD